MVPKVPPVANIFPENVRAHKPSRPLVSDLQVFGLPVVRMAGPPLPFDEACFAVKRIEPVVIGLATPDLRAFPYNESLKGEPLNNDTWPRTYDPKGQESGLRAC